MKQLKTVEISPFHFSETTMRKYIISRSDENEINIELPAYAPPCQYFASQDSLFAILDIQYMRKWITSKDHPEDLKNIINWGIANNVDLILVSQLVDHDGNDIDDTIIEELPLYCHNNLILVKTDRKISEETLEAIDDDSSCEISYKYDSSIDEWNPQQIWVSKDNLKKITDLLEIERNQYTIDFNTPDPNNEPFETAIRVTEEQAEKAAELLNDHNMLIEFQKPDNIIIDLKDLPNALILLKENNILFFDLDY